MQLKVVMLICSFSINPRSYQPVLQSSLIEAELLSMEMYCHEVSYLSLLIALRHIQAGHISQVSQPESRYDICIVSRCILIESQIQVSHHCLQMTKIVKLCFMSKSFTTQYKRHDILHRRGDI